MTYTIEYKKSARKELERLDRETQSRVLDAVDELASAPRPSGVRKIVGGKNVWRIRVGHYRVIYKIYDERLVVMVVRVAHRKEAYT